MASQRWQHLVIEVKAKFFGDRRESLQVELDKRGALGWELVAVSQSHPVETVRLFLKRQS